MGYRPPSAAPLTPWARHLDRVMREQGWSRVRLFEEVGAELGYGPKSRSGFLPLLVDREPTPQQALVLARRFGEPDEPEPVASPATSDTQAGLDALAAAVTALVEELRVDRQERTGLRETVLHNSQQVADLNQAVAELTLRLQRAEGHGATRENGAPVEIG
jgi:hypothetical protein